jgi:predicted signal transduction protein with EAL and GGDEF domain
MTMSPAVALFDAFPDLVLELGRDGTILTLAGGSALPELRLPLNAVGMALSRVYPQPIASLVSRLTRRAITSRESCESNFVHLSARYEVRVSARSADHALCIIRSLSEKIGAPEDPAASGQFAHIDRREFSHHLMESISTASLSGRSVAVAIVHVEGLAEIAKLLDFGVAANVMTMALQRLAEEIRPPDSTHWFLGQLADDELAVLVASTERDIIESRVLQVCEQMGKPVPLGDAIFQLKACAGVAILGQDASSGPALLQRARTATVEARRSELSSVSFFSDTMKLRSLTRIDVAVELREAIANGEIGLHYRGRHELASGRLVALVGYLQWIHPLRGVIRPAQFLPAAAATGLSTALSRSLLECLRRDFQIYRPLLAPNVRISYGALRHHVLDAGFSEDIGAMVRSHALPAECLEIRISERSYVAKEKCEWRYFTDMGVQIVVDEVGRKMSSIDRLARAPISGLQLDRACAAARETDNAADRVGGAVLGVARALGLTPITTAVDNRHQRDALLALGWTHGSGDFFAPLAELGAPISGKSIQT